MQHTLVKICIVIELSSNPERKYRRRDVRCSDHLIWLTDMYIILEHLQKCPIILPNLYFFVWGKNGSSPTTPKLTSQSFKNPLVREVPNKPSARFTSRTIW